VAEWTIKVFQFPSRRRECPGFNGVVVCGNKFEWVIIKELDIRTFLIIFFCCRQEDFALAFTHIPEDKLVSIFITSNCGQEFLIARKAQSLNHLLMIPNSI